MRTEILLLAPKHQDIIIDTGGRDTTSQRAALSVADLLLVPFVPRSFDLWTLETVAKLVDEMKAGNPKLRAFTFLNRADPRGTDNDDAAKELRDSESLQFLDTPIGARKAFSNAAAHGLAVTELKLESADLISQWGRQYSRARHGERPGSFRGSYRPAAENASTFSGIIRANST